MKPNDVFPLIGEAAQAVGAHYGPAYQEKVKEVGFDPQTPDWYLLMVSLDFEPETTSAARFVERTPYTNRQRWEDGLAGLAERGYLQAVGGEYRITDKGHQASQTVLDVFYGTLAELDPLPADDLEHTARLLRRLVDAALAAPEPAEKPILTYNRHSDPGPDGSVLLRILQYGADLGAFRDEIHLASWQQHGVSGQAWEALTFVWRDEAHTPAELVERLPNRGFTEQDYAAALDELAARGWVTKAGDGTYQITDAGKAVRQQSEDRTDQMYYVAWDALSADEVEELGSGLIRLRDRLNEMRETIAEEG
jgi:DNA-binding PadR family transcriptional regulator